MVQDDHLKLEIMKGDRSGSSESESGRVRQAHWFSFPKAPSAWQWTYPRKVNVAENSLSEVGQWREAFRANHGRLIAILSVLCCCDCAEVILEMAENQVKSFVIPDAFRYRFALRTMVKICLTHVSLCGDHEGKRIADTEDLSQRIRALPTPERFIYTLREILKYPRRDVSLLVGVSDEVADRLLRLARRRLARKPIAGNLNSWIDRCFT
jgi:hypothetical protein